MNKQNNQLLELAVYAATNSVGLLALRGQGGFILISLISGAELVGAGPDGGEAWSAEEVLEYCRYLEEGKSTGIYVFAD